uniref:Uncharacterized protein n=1 Tax=Aegilops tauschii subsp. strangulata TaxID=200361 RepID=A0A453AZV9_AEGTS
MLSYISHPGTVWPKLVPDSGAVSNSHDCAPQKTKTKTHMIPVLEPSGCCSSF